MLCKSMTCLLSGSFRKKSADDPIDVGLCHRLIIRHSFFSQYVEDLGKATGAAEVREDFISNLSRISQLTGISCSAAVISSFGALLGFSDHIYAEAYVKMHGFDIMLGVYTSYFLAILMNGTKMSFWSTRRLIRCRISVLTAQRLVTSNWSNDRLYIP